MGGLMAKTPRVEVNRGLPSAALFLSVSCARIKGKQWFYWFTGS